MTDDSLPQRLHRLKKLRHDSERKFNQVMQEKGRSETLNTFWPVKTYGEWMVGFDEVLFCETMFPNFNDRKENGEELTIEMFGQEFLDLIKSMF